LAFPIRLLEQAQEAVWHGLFGDVRVKALQRCPENRLTLAVVALFELGTLASVHATACLARGAKLRGIEGVVFG